MAEWLSGLQIARWRWTGLTAFALALAVTRYIDLPWIQEAGLAILVVVLVELIAEAKCRYLRPRFPDPIDTPNRQEL